MSKEFFYIFYWDRDIREYSWAPFFVGRCFASFTSVGQRKLLSTYEELNLRPSNSALQFSATNPQRLYGKQCPLPSSNMTRVLHAARIGNVDSVVSMPSWKDGRHLYLFLSRPQNLLFFLFYLHNQFYWSRPFTHFFAVRCCNLLFGWNCSKLSGWMGCFGKLRCSLKILFTQHP